MTAEGPSGGFAALEQAFYNDGYRFAKKYDTEGNADKTMFRSLMELYQALDSFIDLFLQKAATEHPSHCRKGCSWCCHQVVYAHTHEFRYLKQWMFTNLDAGQLEKVRKRAAEKHNATSILSANEGLLNREACPMLENHTCTVYEARPVACRIYYSMDVESCKKEFDQPGNRSVFPKLFRLPLQAGRKLNEGFAAGLQERGIHVREHTMEEGLLL